MKPRGVVPAGAQIVAGRLLHLEQNHSRRRQVKDGPMWGRKYAENSRKSTKEWLPKNTFDSVKFSSFRGD
jgi:hypothetical protein